MLNRSTSLISLATISSNSGPYRDHWEEHSQLLAVGAVRNQAETEDTLCARCQNFDIQSFARAADRRRGYLFKDVEVAADQGCQFCGLLLDAVKDAEEPEYFYTNVFGGKTILKPDLYVHMTVSDSYKEDVSSASKNGLRANRILVELGDRFSGIRKPSSHEICIAADPGTYHSSFQEVQLMCRYKKVQQLYIATSSGATSAMIRPRLHTLRQPKAGSEGVHRIQNVTKQYLDRFTLIPTIHHFLVE
jgi:hypothetical protein